MQRIPSGRASRRHDDGTERNGDAVTGLPIHVEFDFRQTPPQTWDIRIETDSGPLVLSGGGAQMSDGDNGVVDAMKEEYPSLSRQFVELAGRSECDVHHAPLQIVAAPSLLGSPLNV